MRRRAVIFGGGALLVPARAAPAQTASRLRRIGVLHWTSFVDSHFATMRSALRELGYFEGRDIVYVERLGRDRSDLAAAAAAELVAMPVDVLVATSTAAAVAAKRATATIPVLISAADPVAAGLVASLARPEGNVTGVSLMAFEFAGKKVEVAHALLPALTRLAFLGQQGEPNAARFLDATRNAARHFGIDLVSCLARDGTDLAAAFEQANRDGAQILVAQPAFHPVSRELAAAAARHAMPAIGEARLFAESGGLLAYGTDRDYTWRRLALKLDRVLRGVKPADLPVEQAIKTVLTINLAAAKRLGLTIPPALLASADEVIE